MFSLEDEYLGNVCVRKLTDINSYSIIATIANNVFTLCAMLLDVPF